MRSKEFLVQKCPTMSDALAELFGEVIEHLKDKTTWQWLIRPEAIQHENGWSAYARIAYK